MYRNALSLAKYLFAQDPDPREPTTTKATMALEEKEAIMGGGSKCSKGGREESLSFPGRKKGTGLKFYWAVAVGE